MSSASSASSASTVIFSFAFASNISSASLSFVASPFLSVLTSPAENTYSADENDRWCCHRQDSAP
jgi:hypothetical protein